MAKKIVLIFMPSHSCNIFRILSYRFWHSIELKKEKHHCRQLLWDALGVADGGV